MNNFEELNKNDVVSVEDFNVVRIGVIPQQMIKVEQFKEQVIKHLIGNPGDQRIEQWLNKGVKSEVLKPGGDWQKGKVKMKITLEFCPDEPTQPASPLDDIRKQIKEN